MTRSSVTTKDPDVVEIENSTIQDEFLNRLNNLDSDLYKNGYDGSAGAKIEGVIDHVLSDICTARPRGPNGRLRGFTWTQAEVSKLYELFLPRYEDWRPCRKTNQPRTNRRAVLFRYLEVELAAAMLQPDGNPPKTMPQIEDKLKNDFKKIRERLLNELRGIHINPLPPPLNLFEEKIRSDSERMQQISERFKAENIIAANYLDNFTENGGLESLLEEAPVVKIHSPETKPVNSSQGAVVSGASVFCTRAAKKRASSSSSPGREQKPVPFLTNDEPPRKSLFKSHKATKGVIKIEPSSDYINGDRSPVRYQAQLPSSMLNIAEELNSQLSGHLPEAKLIANTPDERLHSLYEEVLKSKIAVNNAKQRYYEQLLQLSQANIK